jgi:pimeloyl-ACP methyl ester carboxylesterase
MAERAATSAPATSMARSFSVNPLFGALRVGLRGSESLCAGTAARLAARVFCTPMPTKLSTRRFSPARGVRVQALPFENASLTLYSWPADNGAPRVLLTHGWGGWAMQMAPLAETLAGCGFAPIAVDQPAHGRSAGWHSTLAQFARALVYLGDRFGPLRAVVGHSMGGAAALYAASRALAAERLVTIAAPVDLVQVTRDYAAEFGLREATRAAMVRHIEAREAVVFDRMGAESTAPRVTVPTLVLHDRDDLTVPVQAAERLMALLPQGSLDLTAGLGHRRLLKDPALVARVARFVAST